jgi:hypothetical protein
VNLRHTPSVKESIAGQDKVNSFKRVKIGKICAILDSLALDSRATITTRTARIKKLDDLKSGAVPNPNMSRDSEP